MTSPDSSPIDRATQRAINRIETLEEDFIPAIVYLTNKIRDFSVVTVDLDTAD
jgi:hypothetical protein